MSSSVEVCGGYCFISNATASWVFAFLAILGGVGVNVTLPLFSNSVVRGAAPCVAEPQSYPPSATVAVTLCAPARLCCRPCSAHRAKLARTLCCCTAASGSHWCSSRCSTSLKPSPTRSGQVCHLLAGVLCVVCLCTRGCCCGRTGANSAAPCPTTDFKPCREHVSSIYTPQHVLRGPDDQPERSPDCVCEPNRPHPGLPASAACQHHVRACALRVL